jgi:uncharacterized protein YbbC (DUF1343 family)
MSQILFGIDQALATPHLLPGQIGLVTNEAARTARDATLRTRVALQRAGFKLVRLFSPEHGLGANAADGTAVANAIDALTGLPVVSLYGERLRPPRETLEGLDAVVFDIPDIGARFYTYIWTLSHVLEACAEAGVPLIVLDRPNPLGGDLDAAEGPLLDVQRFGSFLGRAPMPIRHALTLGELVRWWNAEWKLNARLEVISCRGWTRAMHWPETGLPFIQTSPAIARYESALLYPGVCLFEATNLSVGRGTDFAFQVVGAPWLKSDEVAHGLNALGLPGVQVEPFDFTPRLAPHGTVHCQGIRLRVTEAKAFRPVHAGLHLLAQIIQGHREPFRWAHYPTAANPAGEGHFERLIGQAGIRERLEQSPGDLSERIAAWTSAPDWRERVDGCLLYA